MKKLKQPHSGLSMGGAKTGSEKSSRGVAKKGKAAKKKKQKRLAQDAGTATVPAATWRKLKKAAAEPADEDMFDMALPAASGQRLPGSVAVVPPAFSDGPKDALLQQVLSRAAVGSRTALLPADEHRAHQVALKAAQKQRLEKKGQILRGYAQKRAQQAAAAAASAAVAATAATATTAAAAASAGLG